MIPTEGGELYESSQRVSDKRLLEIRRITKLTRTDIMAHRPYTAGAICVITPEAVLYIYCEFRPGPGVAAGMLGKREEVFVSFGGRRWREQKGSILRVKGI